MQFIKPTKGLVTSFFSPQRKNPVTGIYKPHTGVDFGWHEKDDKVVAAAAGRVVVPRVSSVAGNYIWIEHGKYTTVYSHLKSIAVKNGQRVKQGDVIGIKGTTGNSTGVHLHFEIIKHRTFTNDWSKKCNPLLMLVDPTTKEWQGWLKELGYYKGAVDGIYGDNTIKAVLSYQKVNKLAADGVCGRATYNHIKNAHSKLDKKPVAPIKPPAPTNPKVEEEKDMLTPTGREEIRELLKKARATKYKPVGAKEEQFIINPDVHTDAKIAKYSDKELLSYQAAVTNRTFKK